MNAHISNLPPNYQAIVDRFVTACQSDQRILAAFLGGSFARGTADQFSDLDLRLITSEEDFNEFCAQKFSFIQQLGQPEFIEDFDIPHFVFLIFADGSEVELGISHLNHSHKIYSEPFKVLLDKQNQLTNLDLYTKEPDPVEQTEKLRRLIFWFWHDLSHFITAMSRNQLWWAQGQLEELRHYCVNLARLQNNFLDEIPQEEVYFKLEQAMPVATLSSLQDSFCQMNKEEMLAAGLSIVRFYKKMAIPLALSHGISYPQTVEEVMLKRFKEVLL